MIVVLPITVLVVIVNTSSCSRCRCGCLCLRSSNVEDANVGRVAVHVLVMVAFVVVPHANVCSCC